ncbi:MAG: GerMN domain-containing protein, partial [Mycobacteriales bacterium]
MSRIWSAVSAGALGAVLLAGGSIAPAQAATTRTAAVYYVGDTGTRAALYREFRQVPVVGGPITSAVDAMLHLPARDPDYTSLWPRSTRIRGISVRLGVATIDLTAPALTGRAGGAFACATLQQLVYTVTAAAPTVSRVLL